MDEAYMWDWVGKVLNVDPEADVRVPRVYMTLTSTKPSWALGIGYVVMEFIDTLECTSKNAKPVAPAVEKLISIRGPSPAHAHVGGGPTAHTFFVNKLMAPFPYKTANSGTVGSPFPP
jgi:hypothetical protein